MVSARVNAQIDDALVLTKQAIKQAEENGYGPVYVTGHSLGGALAQITACHYNLPGDAFNPYGAAGLAYRLPEGQPANAAPFTNHVMAGDLVSAAGPHYGKVEMYALPKELGVLRDAEQGQRIASPVSLGMKSGHVMSAAVAVQLGDSHRMVHCIDRMTDKGPVQSVLDDPGARITDAEDLRRIAEYRKDIHQLRLGRPYLSAVALDSCATGSITFAAPGSRSVRPSRSRSRAARRKCIEGWGAFGPRGNRKGLALSEQPRLRSQEPIAGEHRINLGQGRPGSPKGRPPRPCALPADSRRCIGRGCQARARLR